MNYPKDMLIQTVKERRHGNLQPVGVMVGIKDHGIIRCGWSRAKLPPATKCPEHPAERAAYNRRMVQYDHFNMENGIAWACLHILVPSPLPVGREFPKKFEEFKARCRKYFKDAKFEEIKSSYSRL